MTQTIHNIRHAAGCRCTSCEEPHLSARGFLLSLSLGGLLWLALVAAVLAWT